MTWSEFQIFGAEIRKACEPNSRLHRGTESRREEEDRRVRTGSWSRSNSARQGGWPVCNALYAYIVTLPTPAARTLRRGHRPRRAAGEQVILC